MNADGELRTAYRTLDEPTRLFGVSLAGWAALIAAGGAGYGWLLISPLPWRANFSLAVIVLGAPAALAVLREQSTIDPGRLLAAVLAWRARPPLLVAPDDRRPVRRHGVRLDTPAVALIDDAPDRIELPWATPAALTDADAWANGGDGAERRS